MLIQYNTVNTGLTVRNFAFLCYLSKHPQFSRRDLKAVAFFVLSRKVLNGWFFL